MRRNMLHHKSIFDKFIKEVLKKLFHQHFIDADINSQLRCGAPTTAVGMAQLLQYNCYARHKEDEETHRHSRDRGAPGPLYMGTFVFAKTRRHLVELLQAGGTGISMPSERVLEIWAPLGEAVVNHYTEMGQSAQQFSEKSCSQHLPWTALTTTLLQQ